jgi:hypothetical protein
MYTDRQEIQHTTPNGLPPIQCFRTLENSGADHKPPLRIIYGSCRQPHQPQLDILNTFGTWLSDHFEQRETQWPHVLLLTGDQIYADEPPSPFLESYPHLDNGATSFDDFALLYHYAFTQGEGIQQVFAAIPTFMMFDDHEILNNWNSWPTWCAEVLQQGKEQTLVDGLLAYWVYQGWGNLLPQAHTSHPLLQIMQAAQEGGDILETLRTCIRSTIYGQSKLYWHYTIPTMPPIFVANTRTERTTLLDTSPTQLCQPTRIMSEEQMAELRAWLKAAQAGPSLLVSTVPVLLPPFIGFVEYLMGIRLWQHSIAPLRWLGQQLARIQLYIAKYASFDHWPLYAATWHELIQLLREHTGDIFILSGDVHFSYAARGDLASSSATGTHCYQLVCSPIQNELEMGDRRMLARQSYITHLSYGGLHTDILPLKTRSNAADMQRNLLFNDLLAQVTLQLDHEGNSYTLQHQYLALVNGHLEFIVDITISGD